MNKQFAKVYSLLFFLLFICIFNCKTQISLQTPTQLDICINSFPISHSPTFLKKCNYNLVFKRYEPDEFELTDGEYDAILYYKSDSLDVKFYEIDGFSTIQKIHIKCKECVYDCGGKNIVSIGDSVDKIRSLDIVEFDKYGKTYYPKIFKNKGATAIPGMIIPFVFKFPDMSQAQEGQMNVGFKDGIVHEIFILFYLD